MHVIRQTCFGTAGDALIVRYQYLRSPGRTLEHLPPFSCCVAFADDPRDWHYLPAGAVYMYGGSSLHTIGSTSLLHNRAEQSGGEQSLRNSCLTVAEILMHV